MILKNREELCERDPLLPEVLGYAVLVEQISTTAIQRRFGLGYPRAARLMDILMEEGFVEKEVNGPRKVLLSQEDYRNLFECETVELKMEEHRSDTPQPKKGSVKLEELKLDKIKFFDEFDAPADEQTAKELNKIIYDILCNDAIINLSSDFLRDFLEKKKFKINYVKCDFDNVSEILRIEDKIFAPIIYIIDIANSNVIDILKKCNLLVKEGSIVMQKTGAENSKLIVLY